MRIGELARQAEVNIQTIRFYERRRILRVPARTAGGYRSYEQQDLEHLRFIKWCQRLGFTLGEVKELSPLHSALRGSRSARNKGELRGIIAMVEGKLKHIDGKIASLQQMSAQVSNALRELRKSPSPDCPASRAPHPQPEKPKSRISRCPKN